MCDSSGLLLAEFGQRWVIPGYAIGCPVGLAMSDQENVHRAEDNRPQYDGVVAKADLVSHLKDHALRTNGPFTLRSGAQSSWYLDARQTTFDGAGARAAGEAVLDVLDPAVEAVGGMTMGADPIAIATAMLATESGRPMRAFSIRKTAKEHGTGGRLVGPVQADDKVAILEDTTTTGGAVLEAAEAAMAEGLVIVQVIALIDRSDGEVAARFGQLDLDYRSLVTPADLGVGS